MDLIDKTIDAMKVNKELWDEGILSAGANGSNDIHCSLDLFLKLTDEFKEEKYIKEYEQLSTIINGVKFYALRPIRDKVKDLECENKKLKEELKDLNNTISGVQNK